MEFISNPPHPERPITIVFSWKFQAGVLEEGWMWQNCSGTWFRRHRKCPLIQMSHFWCKRIWGSLYEPKGSRSAICPACLVNMLCLCGPSDLPKDTIHMCVSITLGNCSQGTAPQMIWAGSELYRMEEMKPRPDKQHLDDNAHTHGHSHNICNVWSLQAVSLSYNKGNTVYLRNQETISLSNTESQTIMKNQTTWL